MEQLDTICSRFQAHLGDERFTKFIRALNEAPIGLNRLRHWQQLAWDKFVATNLDAPADFETVRECFSICELHWKRLLEDEVFAPYSQIQYYCTQSPGGTEAECPYAGWGVSIRDWGFDVRKVKVLFCPECRFIKTGVEDLKSRASVVDQGDRELFHRLTVEYGELARSGINAYAFYSQVRVEGCNKLFGTLLLRELMNCDLKSAHNMEKIYCDTISSLKGGYVAKRILQHRSTSFAASFTWDGDEGLVVAIFIVAPTELIDTEGGFTTVTVSEITWCTIGNTGYSPRAIPPKTQREIDGVLGRTFRIHRGAQQEAAIYIERSTLSQSSK